MVNNKLDFYPHYWNWKFIYVISLLYPHFLKIWQVGRSIASSPFLTGICTLPSEERYNRNSISDVCIKGRSQKCINYALDDEFTFLSSFWRNVHKLSLRNRGLWKNYCDFEKWRALSTAFWFSFLNSWRREKWCDMVHSIASISLHPPWERVSIHFLAVIFLGEGCLHKEFRYLNSKVILQDSWYSEQFS